MTNYKFRKEGGESYYFKCIVCDGRNEYCSARVEQLRRDIRRAQPELQELVEDTFKMRCLSDKAAKSLKELGSKGPEVLSDHFG